MRKRHYAVSLCAVIIVAFGACFLFPPTFSQSSSRVKIGIFYYVWYNPDWSFSWDPTKIVDKPVLGNYNSCDSSIIKQHLLWMQDLGIDFVIISWWGFYDDYGRFTDNATKQVFETAKNMSSNLKFAVMVEPFNKTGVAYDYVGISNHIYENFVANYPSLYYYSDSKPVICFFNDQTLTDTGNIPEDGRFSSILVGQENYTQWIYTDLNPDYHRSLGERQISVTPRYDESHLNRTDKVPIDDYLNEGVYDKEWKNATKLCQEGLIDTVLISSWNEYPERTAIEPHIDATAVNHDPYFLYNKTRDYITLIRQTTLTDYGYFFAATAAILIIAGVSVVFIRRRKIASETDK